MSKLRVIRKSDDYIFLDCSIIQDSRLSLEGKGIYGMLEAGVIQTKDVPDKIIKELVEVGYFEEVAE